MKRRRTTIALCNFRRASQRHSRISFEVDAPTELELRIDRRRHRGLQRKLLRWGNVGCG